MADHIRVLIVDDNEDAAGKGWFLKCDISPATAPLGRRTIPFDPATGSVEPGRQSDHLH